MPEPATGGDDARGARGSDWGPRGVIGRVLCVVVTLLALIPPYGAWRTLAHSPRVSLAALRTPVGVAPAVFAVACHDRPARRPDGITLMSDLNNLDVQDGTESIDLALCIGREVSQALRSDPCKPVLTLVIDDALVPLTGPTRIYERRPVRSVEPNAYQSIGSITLNIAGDPRRYPFDSYAGLLQWSVTFAPSARSRRQRPSCTGLSARTEALDDGVTANGFTDVAFLAGGASALTWRAEQRNVVLYARPHQLTFAGSMQFGGGRPFTTIVFFVLSLLGVLGVLVGVLNYQMFRKPEVSVETLAIVGAMLIAVLPVRAVLVPSAIGSLVWVDYILASLMAILVAGLVIAWVRSPNEAAMASPHGDGADAPAPGEKR